MSSAPSSALLYSVLPPGQRIANRNDVDVLVNLETAHTIGRLLEHLQEFVPGLTGVNVQDPDWLDRIRGRRVYNYTYGFGFLDDCIRPTLTLEAHGLDYAGTRPHGIYLSANKPHAAELMASLGFAVPRHRVVPAALTADGAAEVTAFFDGADLLVVKPAYEESSVGLRLVGNDPRELRSTLAGLWRWRPMTYLVQEYVPGTDVTVPLIGRTEVSCLPPVALVQDEPEPGPFVFDARAKASKTGLHYEAAGHRDPGVLAEVRRMAEQAFAVTGQRDVARMDCRVSPDGRCWFLEINANPALGLGQGAIAVSARAAGLEVGEVVARVLDGAFPDA